ncbi:MAG: hypothetical protein ACTSRG_21875 [Candidatus Helarchaeota archaeon]
MAIQTTICLLVIPTIAGTITYFRADKNQKKDDDELIKRLEYRLKNYKVYSREDIKRKIEWDTLGIHNEKKLLEISEFWKDRKSCMDQKGRDKIRNVIENIKNRGPLTRGEKLEKSLISGAAWGLYQMFGFALIGG